MKKTFALQILCICISSLAIAQTMTQKEAKQLLTQTMTYLKTSDTTDFINQWSLDDGPWLYHDKAFDKHQVEENFKYLRMWLDTIFTKNMKIDYIDIEKEDPKNKANYFAAYNIKAWFRYDKYYSKGFGFNVDYVNGKWLYRYAPDTSTMRKPKN